MDRAELRARGGGGDTIARYACAANGSQLGGCVPNNTLGDEQ
jgi:hypothetical protein